MCCLGGFRVGAQFDVGGGSGVFKKKCGRLS